MVVVSAVLVMDESANVGEERVSFGGFSPERRGPQVFRRRPALPRVQFPNQTEPARHLIVAQPARGIFDVRLQMEYGVAEFLVPLGGHLHEVRHQVRAIAPHQARAPGPERLP